MTSEYSSKKNEGESIKVAAEQRGEVVGVVKRRPDAVGCEEGRAAGRRGAARRSQRYLARQLRREGGQPGRRQLAERRVRVLHQRLVRVRLPSARPGSACNMHTTL